MPNISNIYSFASGNSAGKSLTEMDDVIDMAEFKDISDTFIGIQLEKYPLIITFHKFLMMLDGTLGISYFERFHEVKDFCRHEGNRSVALQTFIRKHEVIYDRFWSTYWPHFNTKLTKNLDPSRVFTEIMSHIKRGLRACNSKSHIKRGLRACDSKRSRQEYISLSDSRVSTLSAEKREGFTMATPQPAEHSGLAMDPTAANIKSQQVTYATKLKSNTRPHEIAARAAKKAFVHGVDSKVIGTTAVINGRKTIFLSKEEDEFMAARYQYSLVGKFSHGYPTMTRLHSKFAALDLKSGFKIGVLDHKHCTSDFDPNEESPIMPIWIKIFGLKPHWFHRQFLFHIASLVGKPLKLDEATVEFDNPIVARICVELNVLEKLNHDIPIQMDGKNKLLKIQYEGIPEYCRICRHKGHSMAACFVNKEHSDSDDMNKGEKENQEWKEKVDLRKRLDIKRGKQAMEGTSLSTGDTNTNPISILKRASAKGNDDMGTHGSGEELRQRDPKHVQGSGVHDLVRKKIENSKRDQAVCGDDVIAKETPHLDQIIPSTFQELNKIYQEKDNNIEDDQESESSGEETWQKDQGKDGVNISSPYNQDLEKDEFRNIEGNKKLHFFSGSSSINEDAAGVMQLITLGREVVVPSMNVDLYEEYENTEANVEQWHETIARGIDFWFEEIRSLFYNEFLMKFESCEFSGKREKGIVSDTFKLSQNFHTHTGVLKLALSVVDLLCHFFPHSVGILAPETSLIYGIGADQVILVRDDSTRKEISDNIGHKAHVLTILECKGLEFQLEDLKVLQIFKSTIARAESGAESTTS
ncbi:hypothetical protein BUALT_Bualt14G0020500 [Buddleja alternifolia]|uniref:DUF4283 domain-containing protein n=1 Tax=Buddleja alternifolia TaxID=168488 RepID=A0AAV6WHF4_9LAMI|nr:hypothetical protein BUALT_Bualt14G0020500 [Buddleja alternifolia]